MLILKILWDFERCKLAKTLSGENKTKLEGTGGHRLPDFKTLQSYSNQDSAVST